LGERERERWSGPAVAVGPGNRVGRRLLKKKEKDRRERWAKLGRGMEREEGKEGFGFFSFFFNTQQTKQKQPK
jgi:hypothetical protein